jgi:hypothetical protein
LTPIIKGIAEKINKQRLYSKKWQIDAFANYQLIQKKLQISRVCSTSNLIETYRTAGVGNQSLLISGLQFDLKPNPNQLHQFYYISLKT